MNGGRLAWINKLIKSRLNDDWMVVEELKSYVLRCKYSERPIIIKKSEDGFYDVTASLNASHWSSNINEYKNIYWNSYVVLGKWFSCEKNLIEESEARVIINYDILGLAFWKMTGVEELTELSLDGHARFKYESSHARRHGYIDRPIVDEWIELLIKVVNKNYGRLASKKNHETVKISCDVDRPYKNHISPNGLIRRLAGDILKRRSIEEVISTLRYSVFRRSNNIERDQWYQNIYWMMDVNEKNNKKMQFNFIAGGLHRLDGHYDIESKNIIGLMRCIKDRGHDIGIHPSYMAYNDSYLMQNEINLFKRVLEELGIELLSIKSRQHYLRWSQKITPLLLEQCGVSEDSTIGFSEMAGFRAGTCQKYHLYDHVSSSPLQLEELPLIAMESAIIEKYGYSEKAMDEFLKLNQRCKEVGGCFSLLWHNSDLNNNEAKLFYQNLVANL